MVWFFGFRRNHRKVAAKAAEFDFLPVSPRLACAVSNGGKPNCRGTNQNSGISDKVELISLKHESDSLGEGSIKEAHDGPRVPDAKPVEPGLGAALPVAVARDKGSNGQIIGSVNVKRFLGEWLSRQSSRAIDPGTTEVMLSRYKRDPSYEDGPRSTQNRHRPTSDLCRNGPIAPGSEKPVNPFSAKAVWQQDSHYVGRKSEILVDRPNRCHTVTQATDVDDSKCFAQQGHSLARDPDEECWLRSLPQATGIRDLDLYHETKRRQAKVTKLRQRMSRAVTMESHEFYDQQENMLDEDPDAMDGILAGYNPDGSYGPQVEYWSFNSGDCDELY